MVDLLRDQFYWPNMNMVADAQHHIQNCDRCLEFKAKPVRGVLHPIVVSYSLQLDHMDCLTIENPKCDRDVNVLVMTDHFTHLLRVLSPVHKQLK